MSWFTENYEKAALGASLVAASCFILAGVSKLDSVDEDFSSVPRGEGGNDPSILKDSAVLNAIASSAIKRKWDKREYDGLPVSVFTGVSLFVNKNKLDTPVYLIKDDPIHPPIPNSWWLDHNIDPGFADSPIRDADGDGYSNIEEYKSKTDPSDAKQYPALLAKLEYHSEESVKWILRPGYDTDGAFTFKFISSEGSNKVTATSPISPGGLFFEKGPSQGRFKLIESLKRKELNKAIGTEVELTIVKVEDQKPNKKGFVYEIPASFRETDSNNFAQYDRTAVVSLNALGLSDQKFRIEENTEFSLPPGAAQKNYKLTKIAPSIITIEFRDLDGNVKTVDIEKKK